MAELQSQLLREREKHDATRDQLKAAQDRAGELQRQVQGQQRTPGAAAQATPPAATTTTKTQASGRAAGGHTSRASAGRTAASTKAAAGAAGANGSGASPAPRATAAAARSNKRRRTDVDAAAPGGPEPMEVEPRSPPAKAARTPAGRRGAAAATPATPSTGGPGGTPVVVMGDVAAARAALPPSVASMSIAEMQHWVTAHRLEDEEFMALAGRRGKKTEWVDYVTRRAGL